MVGFGIKVDVAVIADQPLGASVKYVDGPAAGGSASITSKALTFVGRYKFDNNFSVHGGLRVQTIEATAAVPFVGGYTVDGERDTGVGYVAGVAYERPDIAMRVSLTYNSKIKHDLDTSENSVAIGSTSTSTEIETPQSLNLEFQTGIAADTLLFGGVRWVDWSEFDITPARYAGGSLVDYSEDVVTYTLGVGRRFSDVFSGQFSVSYEEAQGGLAPNLGPTDGYISYSIGGEYKVNDQTKLRGGIRYIDIGDATTTASIPFADNSAIAVGASVVYTF